jgi:trimeric autotransporter adhesin
VIRRLINSDKPHALNLFALALLFILAAVAVRAQTAPPYTITTIAGQLGGTPTYSGDGGAATSASLWGPSGLLFDSAGNLDIADTVNQLVRQINTSGEINTIAGTCPATPCVGTFSGDKGPATKAGLDHPSGLAFDSQGNLYIADTDNFEIREIVGGTIGTFAGNNGAGATFGGDLGAATSASLWNPSSVAVDPSGNVYIADAFNNVVRVVCETQTPIACTNIEFGSDTWAAGDINTFSGNNAMGVGYQGDGGAATGALLNNPAAVLLDPAGNLYISDSGNNVIRVVNTSGIISTLVGDGTGLAGYKGDGGPANQAQLNNPKALAMDSSGNLYIADTDNCVIRMVEPNGGTITTIAGNHSAGCGSSGNNGPATSAQLNLPAGIAVNGTKIYIGDTANNAVRMLTPAPELPQINAGGVITAGSFGASTTVAPGSWIEIYGTYLAADARSWGTADFNGSNAPTSLDKTSVTVGGQSAFVAYISPGQVNVEVPSNVTAGTQQLILTTGFGSTAAYNLTIGTVPGIYAPSILNIGGIQYAGALLANSATWVLPAGAVSGLTSQPAAPGDIITLYGVGFGTVTPAVAAGQLVPETEQTTLTAPVQILFGTASATLLYQGLAPGFVGLYQFNVQVPSVAANNAVPLTFSQGGVNLPQTLYTAVGN